MAKRLLSFQRLKKSWAEERRQGSLASKVRKRPYLSVRDALLVRIGKLQVTERPWIDRNNT